MNNSQISTQPYKGVRDFYPEEMAVQRYIFDIWSMTAESFGYERYDASVLEPSDLYKAKGSENEEMVNEQTYTFIDRGNREVTLRPEMTPTVARMIAGRKRELTFPVRWYSIPNLFRYERPQKGRLREHWQLNCDLFGSTDFATDVEVIALAYQIFLNFGATPDMFEIRINDRTEMRQKYAAIGVSDLHIQDAITRLNDRFHKVSKVEYLEKLHAIVQNETITNAVWNLISGNDTTDTNNVAEGLRTLGIHNVKIDRSIARGFNYYTGTIFEIFDISGENNRSMMGGGRYDNLTAMFGGESISGIGFGMGDVTMRDFLVTHQLTSQYLTPTEVMIIPTSTMENMQALQVAHSIRNEAHISVITDIGAKKLKKKIADASARHVEMIIVIGENEINTNTYTLKYLREEKEISGSLTNIIQHIIDTKYRQGNRL
jgi:histidyl-tRNA synthetase